MGLFSKRDACPICGGKVKGLFPWKIEGQQICADCHGSVDLPQNVENNMTLDDFRGYMAFREENAQLRNQFQTTQKVDFGLFDTKFMFDMEHKFLCMNKNLNTTIFEGKHIRSFAILEDSAPLFEGSAAGLQCYVSTVPDAAMAMVPQIEQHLAMMQMHRSLERMADRLDDDRDRVSVQHTPTFDIPEPFKSFNVEIYFDHPYWDVFRADMSGPTFSNTYPDINDYLRDYNAGVETMNQLAYALMDLAFPGAGAQVIDPYAPAPEVPAPAPVDTVEELKRYKELMDQGILTEEEFTAKKRQLLGI